MYLVIEYYNYTSDGEPFSISFHGLFETKQKAKDQANELAKQTKLEQYKSKIRHRLEYDMLEHKDTKCVYTVFATADERRGDNCATMVYKVLEMKTS